MNISYRQPDPAFNGEGFNVLSTPNGMLVIYYGYRGSGRSGASWLLSSLLKDDIEFDTPYELTLSETEGGTFAEPVPSAESLKPWGTVTVTFKRCGRADFNLQGLDGNKLSQAVLLAGIEGTTCE